MQFNIIIRFFTTFSCLWSIYVGLFPQFMDVHSFKFFFSFRFSVFIPCARAILVTWLGSGSCQARPSRLNTNEWMNESHVTKYPCLIFLCSDDKPCKNHIIAFSGFEGEERARIRFMIEATGAKCTSYFTKHNHILVCRRLVVIMRCLHKGLKL